MTEYSEIVPTNHRGYIIDIDINEYFRTKTNKLDEIVYSKLNSARKSYRKRFVEGIEQLIVDNNLDNVIWKLDIKDSMREELEIIDQILNHYMNIMKKQIEGPTRSILHSSTKSKAITEVKYWIARKKIAKGGKIDIELQSKQEEELGIRYENLQID